jgi:hypothetical protein
MLLAPPAARRTEVRIGPLPQPRRSRIRLRWPDVLCAALIAAAAIALYLHR